VIAIPRLVEDGGLPPRPRVDLRWARNERRPFGEAEHILGHSEEVGIVAFVRDWRRPIEAFEGSTSPSRAAHFGSSRTERLDYAAGERRSPDSQMTRRAPSPPPRF